MGEAGAGPAGTKHLGAPGHGKTMPEYARASSTSVETQKKKKKQKIEEEWGWRGKKLAPRRAGCCAASITDCLPSHTRSQKEGLCTKKQRV